MLVGKPVRSKTFLATLSVLVVVAGMLFGANVASADSVQYQSYQRASQSEACTAQVGETPWQSSWGADSSWSPSYEMWANNGTGGWTCGRSMTWARTPVAASSGGGSVTYALGDIGPGGGLVFLISGGLTYEMAPKTWGANETTGIAWCSDTTNSVSTNDAIGTGSANTTAMLTTAGSFVACTSSAPNAVDAYAGGGLTDWFLPSKDELNAMCNYSRNPTTPPTGACTGAQDGTFSTGTYGFASAFYWSSSQLNASSAWLQHFDDGNLLNANKNSTLRVRQVRAF